MGQYEDQELDGLYYNRFRYYNPESGLYISQDPIRLAGNNPNFYAYVHDSNTMVDVFGLMELFRSMIRAEYFDIIQNGWKAGGDTGGMWAKWFAESFDNAVEWGKTMGHGSDSKFYVVSFDVDDAVAKGAYKVDHLDGIGLARAIEVADLNGKTEVKKVNSIRVKCKK
nr:RHS repeat-associated core domain-containing protein [Gilliamella apicola]